MADIRAGHREHRLTLVDSTNTPIATTYSTSSGSYQFTERNINTNIPAQVSFTATFPATNSSVTQSAAISQFDPTLGTLTSIDIIATGSTSSHAVVENLDPSSQSVQLEYSSSIKYNVNGTALSGTATTFQQALLGTFDGQADLQGASSDDFGNTPLAVAFNPTTITNPSDMAAFVGTGTVNVTESGSAAVCNCDSADTGNLLTMVRSTTSGSVNVVYHYTPSNVIGPGQYKVIEAQPGGFTDSFDTADNSHRFLAAITPTPSR